jgi:hypothetical protein
MRFTRHADAFQNKTKAKYGAMWKYYPVAVKTPNYTIYKYEKKNYHYWILVMTSNGKFMPETFITKKEAIEWASSLLLSPDGNSKQSPQKQMTC